MDRSELMRLFDQCDQFLIGRGKLRSPKKILAQLASEFPDDGVSDMYGQGELIESFEREIAGLLGKEAAVFMPSGTMAQQIALRIWSEWVNCRNVAFHPTCHLEIHEQMAYRYLHNLQAVLVGSPYNLMTLADLEQIKQPLGSILIELPQREIGGQLPDWDELVKMAEWARERNIRLHLDGARLWECKPFYGREYAEIAGLFDSVYVSMYKGLGAIAGALLAGTQDFIAEARIWLRRHGGNLIAMYPFVLTARAGVRDFLPRMGEYHLKALEVAEIFSSMQKINVLPNPPQTNMMHVFITADKDAAEEALAAVAREHKLMLMRGFTQAQIPGVLKTEVTIQDGALKISKEEIQQAVMRFYELI